MSQEVAKTPRKISLHVLAEERRAPVAGDQLPSDTSPSAQGRDARATPAPPDLSQIAHVNRPPRSDEHRELEEKIVSALRQVYDPEIPINLYDLGLIYEIQIISPNSVRIRMTLTAPGCPVAGVLPLEVESRVTALVPEITEAVVELVWDPPWAREMMSEVARLELGM